MGLASLIILANLLGPEVYGLFILALVVVGLVEVLVGGHTAEIIVQRQDLEPGHEAAVFCLQLTVASLSAVAIWLGMDVIAGWMDAPGLSEIALGVAVLPLLTALSGVPTNRLIRWMRYDQLTRATLLSSVVAFGLGVGLALNGAGIWSLVAMEMARRVVQFLVVVTMARWRPHVLFNRSQFGTVVWFAARRVENMGIAYVAQQVVPRIMIGKLLGAEALGIYAVAYRLISHVKAVLCDSVAAVIFPAAAKLQDDRPRLKRLLETATRLMTWTAWPAFFGLIAVAPLIVPVVFDETWSGLAITLQLLAVGALRAPLSSYTGSVLKATGRLSEITKMQLISLVLTVPLCWYGAQYGLAGIAAALSLRQWLLWPVGALYVRAVSDLSPLKQLRILAISGLPSILMFGGLAAWLFGIGSAPGAVFLGLAVMAGAATYGLIWLAWNWRAFADLRAATVALLKGERRIAREHFLRIAAPVGPN